MKRICTLLCAGVLAGSAQAANVGVDNSSAPWLGFMNVFALPQDGGGYIFGSPWGIADLVATFDDGYPSISMFPNSIGDPNEFWYQDPTGGGNPNPGGPGAPGNKIMEANLYQEVSDGSLSGTTVTFSGYVLSNTFTDAHDARIFIRDFAPDYSSSVDVYIDATVGYFSFSLNTIADPARHVQWGFQVKGVNVWITDIAPFGSVTYSSIPAPASMALLTLGGLAMRRRR
ncbi:MAG: PEP-CTERM sorting domain-containing protein [Leptolyngbya sp. PLA3]|nr:MAG: PEP-CTERM sorting domain-containing protein [Cyanobacteria bacterium CYA]MCE7969848.1 PEP-CTERM sorting domain-containing protein [Leptolyngbya sp. PL-A3]